MKTKFRLFFIFHILFSCQFILAQIPTNGLVGFYNFDGNPNDESGNGRNGTDNGASLYVLGVCDLARYFYNDPSATNNFNYTSIPNIINSTAFTISFRTKVNKTGTHQSFLYLSSGNNWVIANLWLFLTTEDKLCAIVNGLDLRTIDYSHNALVAGQYNINYLNSKPLQWDKYYFITAVFHNNILTYYLDGNKYSEYNNVNTQIGTPATSVKLGICPEQPQPGFFYFLDGIMDRLSIYNRALSENEINSLYNSNCSPVTVNMGKIDGLTQVCKGMGGLVYTVSEMQNIDNYSWTYNGKGATINGTSDSIKIDFDENATSGTLTVIGYKIGGIGADTASISITLNSPPGAAGNIIGADEVCVNQKGVNYNIAQISNATNYVWDYSGIGGTIIGNSENVIINFTQNASNGNLSVYGNNNCGNGATSMPFPINLNELPSAAGKIAGDAEVCLNQKGVNYQVTPITNASSYVWNYSGIGGTIIGNSENVIINFTQKSSNGNLSVYGNNNCGNGAPSPPFAINLQSCINNGPVNINIPNSFSPNGDGINDVFFIRGLTENARLIIFDREGKNLYETDNYQNNWGGRDSKDRILESGTYWYVLILPGIPTEFKGYVYIKF